MMEIIIIVIGSNHRKDKKAGGLTQGRHLSDVGATLTIQPHFAAVQYSNTLTIQSHCAIF